MVVTEEHKAYVDELKARGDLPDNWRYEWALPKRFRGRGKGKDKAVLAELRQPAVTPVAGAVGDTVAPMADDAWDDEPDESADAGDADSITWNKQELKRLRLEKQGVTQRLLGLESGDKDGLALCKQQIAAIESQEDSCRKVLALFNKKRLDAESTADVILIKIEPWQDDGTAAVQAWL